MPLLKRVCAGAGGSHHATVQLEIAVPDKRPVEEQQTPIIAQIRTSVPMVGYGALHGRAAQISPC